MPSHSHTTVSKPDELTLLQVSARFGIVMLISVILGVVLPGILAYRGKVFYPESTKATVLKEHPELVDPIKAYEARQAELKELIASIDNQVRTGAISPDKAEASRQSYKTELEKSGPASIQAFYLHLIMYFWPIMYFGLGSVAFVLRPNRDRSFEFTKRLPKTFFTTLCLYVFIVGPVVFRTQIVASLKNGRTVFAYSNPDIDLPSHVDQLANFAIFAFLLAVIWIEWSARTSEVARDDHDVAESISPRHLDQLSKELIHWQVVFILTSIGFIVYTAIFWDQIIIHSDYRFGLEALGTYLIWIATVIFISAPFALRWRQWQLQKINVISSLVSSGQDADIIKAKVEAIGELQPIGKWNLTASGIGVLLSFAGPLIQALIKKSFVGEVWK